MRVGGSLSRGGAGEAQHLQNVGAVCLWGSQDMWPPCACLLENQRHVQSSSSYLYLS